MTYLAVVQARIGSSRLPGKVLKDLAGKPVLAHVVTRLKKAQRIDRIVVATSVNRNDDAIVAWCEENGVDCYRGDEEDVLARYAGALEAYPSDAVVRITADCPAIDPGVVDRAIVVFENNSADYASNTRERTFPRGLDVEVFRAEALLEANKEAQLPFEREHVTPFIWTRNARYRCVSVLAEPDETMPELRITLDTYQDYVLLACVFDLLGESFSCRQLVGFARQHPWLKEINGMVEQKPVFAHPDSRVRLASELHYAANYCMKQGLINAAGYLLEATELTLEGKLKSLSRDELGVKRDMARLEATLKIHSNE